MGQKSYALWYIYIIECNDGKLYTGITNNLRRRIKDHNSGKGGRFTKYRCPVTLQYSRRVATKSAALKEEARIKRLPRAKKLALIKTAQATYRNRGWQKVLNSR